MGRRLGEGRQRYASGYTAPDPRGALGEPLKRQSAAPARQWRRVGGFSLVCPVQDWGIGVYAPYS
jgi:hypothetical protein